MESPASASGKDVAVAADNHGNHQHGGRGRGRGRGNGHKPRNANHTSQRHGRGRRGNDAPKKSAPRDIEGNRGRRKGGNRGRGRGSPLTGTESFPLSSSQESNGGVDTDTFPERVTFEQSRSPGHQSKRGVSINHLVFTTEKRSHPVRIPRSSSSSSSRKHLNHRVFMRETFVQANCHFRVRQGKDYSIFVSDPDKLLDWDDIYEISIPTVEQPTCPICLDPPIAAKITKCGHIYCWHCILHHLALTDSPRRTNCPICEEYVDDSDLRSVQWRVITPPAVGKSFELSLLKRSKESSFVVYKNQWNTLPKDNEDIFNSVDIDHKYFKFLPISNTEMHERVLKRERDQISFEKATLFTVDPFLEEAMRRLSLWEQAHPKESHFISKTRSKEKLEIQDNAAPENTNATFLAPPPMSTAYSSSASGGWQSQTIETNSTQIPDKDTHVQSSDDVPQEKQKKIRKEIAKPEGQDSNAYLFYQATDGQLVFLHPFNIMCLEHEYGKLESCPDKIIGQVLDVQSEIITTEIRKRFRHLNHLPQMTEILRVELDLSRTLSDDTKKHFKKDVEKRKQARKKKANMEKRLHRQMQKEHSSVHSLAQFEVLSSSPSEMTPELMSWLSTSAATDDPSVVAGSPPRLNDTPSFSQAAKLQIQSGPIMSNLEENPPLSASYPPKRSSWVPLQRGKTTTSAKPSKAPATSEELTPDEVEFAPPDHQASFLKGLEGALSDTRKEPTEINQGGKGSKKKKQLLFTTGGNRGYE
eukprot:m.135992 g.135992  ORF g.135992 m.135992 type:complete len:755 (-) comp14720_c0_seq3:1292-3556(-)